MSEQEETLPPMSLKRIAIVGGVLVAVIIIVLVATNVSKSKLAETSPQGKLETSTVEAIKATVNVNYVKEGKYAYSYENLIEESEPEYQNKLKEWRDELKDFDYSVRGDGKGYKITYTNIDGDRITVAGNYSEEYH
jgi:maltose-binding protein MalE